jgi:hypothetical protein
MRNEKELANGPSPPPKANLLKWNCRRRIMNLANNFPSHEKQYRPQQNCLVMVCQEDGSWSELPIELQKDPIRRWQLDHALERHPNVVPIEFAGKHPEPGGCERDIQFLEAPRKFTIVPFRDQKVAGVLSNELLEDSECNILQPETKCAGNDRENPKLPLLNAKQLRHSTLFPSGSGNREHMLHDIIRLNRIPVPVTNIV